VSFNRRTGDGRIVEVAARVARDGDRSFRRYKDSTQPSTTVSIISMSDEGIDDVTKPIRRTSETRSFSASWFLLYTFLDTVFVTLGTGAQIPTGYMVKTLRAQSTCDSNVPSDQMLSIF